MKEFDFDDTGNRIDEGGKAGQHNRQVTQGDYRYGYDAEGNRTVKVFIGNPANAPEIVKTTDAYDHANRPVTIRQFDAIGTLQQEIHYGYDALGRRVGRSVGELDDVLGSLTESDYDVFVWDGDQVLAELTRDDASDANADTLATTYFNGPGTDQLLAVEDHTGEIDDVVWTLADHLGSIRTYVTLDDTTSQVTGAEQLVYAAFGEEQLRFGNDIGTDEILIARFTGREYDAAAELYYYRNRYYDAALGKFLTEDPSGFAAGDANLYRYVGNGPTNATDPSGLEEVYLLHDTNPDSASAILDNRFNSQRGFISFKDTVTKDQGMRASRHATQTARIAVQLEVGEATDITRVLKNEIADAAKVEFARQYPGQDFRSATGNKAYTRIKFELLHRYMQAQEGNIFRQKTGGGYHYFVRELGTGVSGRAVGVAGYDFANQDLSRSALSRQLIPRNNLSSRLGRGLVRVLPSDSAISGAGSTAPMALWIVGSEARYHTMGSHVTGGEYAPAVLCSLKRCLIRCSTLLT